VFDDSSDNFIDLTDLHEQPEPSDNFDELVGDEDDAPVASIECCGVKSLSGALATIDQWAPLSGWAL
jgi:hypothetical protein